MSGHSKWSKVKHQKAVTDVAKAAAFTKASRAITVAVTDGGGTDPDTNFRLRLAVEKAHSVNMPAENIKRAIDRGAGAAGTLKQEAYEGYGPFGVAFLVEVTTDNTNRSVSFVKQALEHAGGSVGKPGCVAYLFKRTGLLIVTTTLTFDALLEIAITAGAEDIIVIDGGFEILTDFSTMQDVRRNLLAANIPVESAEIVMIPQTTVNLDELQKTEINALVDRLAEHDDVQEVYTNMA